MSWMPSDDAVLGDPKTCCGERTDVQAKQRILRPCCWKPDLSHGGRAVQRDDSRL